MVEVFILGGGTPTPNEFRFGSAHSLRIGDEAICAWRDESAIYLSN